MVEDRHILIGMAMLAGASAISSRSRGETPDNDNGSGGDNGDDGEENGDGLVRDGNLVIETEGPGGSQYLFIAETVEAVTDPEQNDTVTEIGEGVMVNGASGVNESIDEWSVTGLKELQDTGGDEPAVFVLNGEVLNPDDYTIEYTGDGPDEPAPSGDALAHSSLDTESEIKASMGGFWHEAHPGHATGQKVTAVSSPAIEGSGCMRIDQPDESTGRSEYSNANNFYGTETHHYTCGNPGSFDNNAPGSWRYSDVYPSDGIPECHIRYYVMLDNNYDYEDFKWRQIGKGFPGISGRWGGDAQDQNRPWLVNGAIYTADEIGESQSDWILSAYLYDLNTGSGSSGRTYHPDMTMSKGEWYQIDRYVDVSNNIFKQWQDERLTIDLDGGQLDFPSSSPYDKVYSVRNLFYAGGGWGTPDGSGHNYAYVDNIEVFDREVL